MINPDPPHPMTAEEHAVHRHQVRLARTRAEQLLIMKHRLDEVSNSIEIMAAAWIAVIKELSQDMKDAWPDSDDNGRT